MRPRRAQGLPEPLDTRDAPKSEPEETGSRPLNGRPRSSDRLSRLSNAARKAGAAESAAAGENDDPHLRRTAAETEAADAGSETEEAGDEEEEIVAARAEGEGGTRARARREHEKRVALDARQTVDGSGDQQVVDRPRKRTPSAEGAKIDLLDGARPHVRPRARMTPAPVGGGCTTTAPVDVKATLPDGRKFRIAADEIARTGFCAIITAARAADSIAPGAGSPMVHALEYTDSDGDRCVVGCDATLRSQAPRTGRGRRRRPPRGTVTSSEPALTAAAAGRALAADLTPARRR